MLCCVLCCFPAPQIVLARFRRVIVIKPRLVNKELTFYENSDCITKLFGKNEIIHTQKGKEMAFDFTEDKDRRVESCRLKIIEVVMSVLVQ